jgi:cytoskeleton protein RodZ
MGVGRRLQQAREARGLSLAQVASRTKISLRQLALLEAEDYGRLPQGIFVRGFLKASADVVGLDPDELIRQFHDETGPPSSPPQPHEDSRPSDAAVGPKVRLRIEPIRWAPARVGGWVTAVVLVAAAVLALSWLRPAPERSVALEPAAAAAARTSHPPAPPAQPVGTMGRKPAAAADAEVALNLTADRACWVSLTVDGERVVYRTLAPGEAVRARMRQQASLRVGDAGALRVSADASVASPLGRDGEVRTLVLTPATYRSILAAGGR